MRVVFMGTPEFAVPSLDVLLNRHDVVAVYTRPDAASGRGRKVADSPVKARALASSIPVEQPRTLRDPSAVASLRAYAPDIVVVAAYGLILPPEILGVARYGCVNVHGSVLPRWRGAAPIQRAILAGDAETGVSIMQMEVGLDTGPTCLIRTTATDRKSSGTLTSELADLGAQTLLEALAAIEAGTVEWTPQDDALATYADKLSAADVALHPELTVAEALRRVRASGPSAPCRLALAERRLVVLEAAEGGAVLAPGGVACGRQLELGLADGALVLERVVPEGRSAMDGASFARGARLADDSTWSAL